ncbi:hypothetical protein C0585_07355 [Candidatus Woesearchaeota archaeon]|nr:MAG: hypothetical protein C0585_07355 [Candidatus Woesearchaeota archaeon]
MERGETISHRFILFINFMCLIGLVGFIAIGNLDVNLGMLIIGFSPSILALVLNALMDKHIKEAYYYLFIPFISVVLFILIGILLIGPLIENMDIETLSSINFIFTLIFAFIYYFSSRKRKIIAKKINHKKTQPKPIIEEAEPVKKEEVKEETQEIKKEPASVIKEKVVHHVHHVHHEKEKEHKIEKKEYKNPYIEELRKEFDIINIDQKEILDTLKGLSFEKEKDVNIKDILSELEKKHMFFASNTGEKYHKPLCIVINHISNDKIIAFKDEAEAKMEGYKPCRVCMPEK